MNADLPTKTRTDPADFRPAKFAKPVSLVFFVVALALTAVSARADGWTSNFVITSVFVAQQNNFQYRVNGMPADASCTNATTWGYLNDSDPGSQGAIAAILGAYYGGRQISLHVVAVNGFCHIIELVVSG